LSAVLDANALIVLALDRERSVAVETLLRTWKAEERSYRASALALAVSAGQLASETWLMPRSASASVPIVLHQPKDTRRSWRWRNVLSAAVHLRV